MPTPRRRPPSCRESDHSQVARWLNRDPINEIGFNLLIRSQNPFNLDEEKNLYGFVRNSPGGLVDSDGRIVPILIVAGWAAWQAACTIHAANKAVETFPTDDKNNIAWQAVYTADALDSFKTIGMSWAIYGATSSSESQKSGTKVLVCTEH
ncbi:MAG TPA: hypothetical protein PKN95_12775 [Verrucomicrobiota bacterium]|nr:hypothetical protein [Verrucomicrobiota bacterium]HNT15800.1 hypothetical protein [Verrucomicrobiota bacterium]